MEKLSKLFNPYEERTRKKVLDALEELRNNHERVGFVSTVVLSDNLYNFWPNLLKLWRWQKRIEDYTKGKDIKIVSALNFWDSELILHQIKNGKMAEGGMPNQRVWLDAMYKRHITDLYLLPGWLDHDEIAIDELLAAGRNNIRVHNLDIESKRLPETLR